MQKVISLKTAGKVISSYCSEQVILFHNACKEKKLRRRNLCSFFFLLFSSPLCSCPVSLEDVECRIFYMQILNVEYVEQNIIRKMQMQKSYINNSYVILFTRRLVFFRKYAKLSIQHQCVIFYGHQNIKIVFELLIFSRTLRPVTQRKPFLLYEKMQRSYILYKNE